MQIMAFFSVFDQEALMPHCLSLFHTCYSRAIIRPWSRAPANDNFPSFWNHKT